MELSRGVGPSDSGENGFCADVFEVCGDLPRDVAQGFFEVESEPPSGSEAGVEDAETLGDVAGGAAVDGQAPHELSPAEMVVFVRCDVAGYMICSYGEWSTSQSRASGELHFGPTANRMSSGASAARVLYIAHARALRLKSLV